MNVDDVDDAVVPETSCRLGAIFNRQHELMEKYGLIEWDDEMKTSIITTPIHLDDKYGQMKLKDFAWRITEELTEATEALSIHPGLPQHWLEELSDAYHFLIELTLISGLDTQWLYDGIIKRTNHEETQFNEICGLTNCLEICSVWIAPGNFQEYTTPRQYVYEVIQELGNAMNCLKQKPWKQTHIITDKEKFKKHMLLTHINFFRLINLTKLTADEWYRMYYKKSEVNKFRQRSNY